ncbi:MAG: type II-A CRISPR-associated protein Csn2 [Defluviitaleaceae bacterium]|nr:type II-A CRISPR-associated protein Csn2 [Defluviitaleaceae bacterium]
MGINLNFDMLDEPIPLNGVTGLVTENRRVFAKLVQAIHAYTPDSPDVKLFTDKYERLKPDEIMPITDILGFELNSAAVAKMIYSDLESQITANPELHCEAANLFAQIVSLITRETLDFEPDLQIGELSLQKIFKALEIKIETSDLTIFERVFDIIRVFKYLRKKQLLIFINLGTYLTNSEMESVTEYASLQNINMLLLDNAPFDAPPMLTQYVLDEDFVLLKTSAGSSKKPCVYRH